MLSGRNILITGASRGLGLEIVKQLIRNPTKLPSKSPALIVATCRNPDQAPELQQLAEEDHNRLLVKQFDVTDFNSYPKFMREELEVTYRILHFCFCCVCTLVTISFRIKMLNIFIFSPWWAIAA